MQYNRSSFPETNNNQKDIYWNEHPERTIDYVNDESLINKRRVETSLQREIRLAKDAARAAERRRKETSPERRKRLAESAAHTAQKRKMETPGQREARLAKDAARAAERRRRETEVDRQKRLAADAARHAYKRSNTRQERNMTDYAGPMEQSNSLYMPNMQMPYHQLEFLSHDLCEIQVQDTRFSPPSIQQRHGTQFPLSYQSKYSELLNAIEDLGREIKPTYAGSKMAQERLKKGIMHARDLVRECLAEVDKSSRQ